MATLLLVSLSLGLSNFAAAVGIGLTGADANKRLRTVLAFGAFEALMPILGLLFGRSLGEQLDQVGRYIGAALITLVGLYALYKSRRAKQDTEDGTTMPGELGFGHLLLTALALSLDNFVVGFALSFTNVSMLVAPVVIAIVSAAMSLVGLELGQHLGTRLGQWSEELGGAVLVGVGLAIGAGVLG